MLTSLRLATGEDLSTSEAAEETSIALSELGVRESHAPLLKATLATLNAAPSQPATPIQAECWRWLLAPSPPDLVGIAPTGSGKTLGFLIPAFARLISRQPLAPPPMATAEPPAVDAPEVVAKAKGEEAMRAAATSSFHAAVAEGKSQDEAKNVARDEAKAAYSKAYKGALKAAKAAAKEAVFFFWSF